MQIILLWHAIDLFFEELVRRGRRLMKVIITVSLICYINWSISGGNLDGIAIDMHEEILLNAENHSMPPKIEC